QVQRPSTSSSQLYGSSSPNLSWDNPFPPFTVAAPEIKSKAIEPLRSPSLASPTAANSMHPPLSPKADATTLLKRMNAIAKGPFDFRRGGSGEGNEDASSENRRTPTNGDLKEQTLNSKSSGKDVFRRPSATSETSHSSQNPPHQRNVSSGGGPSSRGDAPVRPRRPTEAIDKFLEQLQSDGEMTD
ncbi:hypothetical protein LTS18_000325, partial [Coniosporium uncinatum]